MEIASVETAYLDNVRNNVRLSSSASPVHNSQNFAEVVERAKANHASVSRGEEEQVDKTSELYQLCLDLETFIVKNMLNGMRNTIQKTGLIDDSFAGKMYEDMLYDEYAKDFTKSAGFGLAEQAYRQLSRYNA